MISSVAALLQYQDVVHLMPVLIVFAIGHSLESMLLTPWLVGNKIGLHPVAVMFAVLAGGQIVWVFRYIVTLPVASVIMVLLRHIHELIPIVSFIVFPPHDGVSYQAKRNFTNTCITLSGC